MGLVGAAIEAELYRPNQGIEVVGRRELSIMLSRLLDPHHSIRAEVQKAIQELSLQSGRPMTLLHPGTAHLPTLWLLGWRPGDHTEIHDHDRSEVAVAVVQGSVVEDIYPFWGKSYFLRRNLGAGNVVTLPAPYCHRVGALPTAEGLSVTLHAYFPILNHMRMYREFGSELRVSSEWHE